MDYRTEIKKDTIIIECLRGFTSTEQIESRIGVGTGNECNGCKNFTYSCGTGSCVYIAQRFFD